MLTPISRGKASRLVPLLALLIWSCGDGDVGLVEPTSIQPDDLVQPTQVDGSGWTAKVPDEEVATDQGRSGLSAAAMGAALSAVPTDNLLYPLPDDRTPNDGDNTNDGGWQLVDFCTAGLTGAGPAQPPDCHHNDDDSAVETLSFAFEFYGAAFNQVYVNNNGNLSFGQLFSTFTSTGFPVWGYPMVAPFWGDVDTGDQDDPPDKPGHVWHRTIGNTYVVTWDEVGYYNENDDKKNTFQVAISDGLDPIMGLGNNVCFSYQDMQWTTGSASGGIGGFGGTPATVGVNRGDGVDFAQIGRFDHEGTDYDGPGGGADGVSYLDGQRFCFNVSGENIPPIAQNFPAGNTITPQCGEGIDLQVQFSGPEIGETVQVAIDDLNDALGAGLTITITPGNPATVHLEWADGPTGGGTYELLMMAMDDGSPEPEVTVEMLTIEWPVCNQPPVADPNGPYLGQAGTATEFDGSGSSDPDGDPLTYSWDWGDESTTTTADAIVSHSYVDAGFYDVCLTVNDGLVDSPTVCTSVVVYDPSAGFITGGGWIASEVSASSGKANFGFVARYQRGQPRGNVEFHAGDLNFHASSYEWLVVTPAAYAVLKGTGTVNGGTCSDGSEYRFQLWAGDGDPDTFRIKVWCETAGGETVVYDNGFDQALGGGSIVIHRR